MGDNIYEFFFSKNYPLGGIGGIISTCNTQSAKTVSYCQVLWAIWSDSSVQLSIS